VDLAAVGGDEADALAAVVRGTAAQGDQAVAAFLLVHFHGVVNVLVSGVGDGFVEHGILHAVGVQHVGHHLEDADLHDTLVSNDQRFGAAQRLDLLAADFHRADADLGNAGDEETIIVTGNQHGANLTWVKVMVFCERTPNLISFRLSRKRVLS